MPADLTAAEVAAKLDHAVLKPQATEADLKAAAAMCRERMVGCLCVRPADVAAASQLLSGSTVVVANVGAFLSGHTGLVRADIAAVVAEAKAANEPVLVKVILETCLLSLDQVAAASLVAEEAGADYVKTSTGFAAHGATPEAVVTMLETVGGRLGVKASGGIRTWAEAVRYIELGCVRIGVGDAPAILDSRPDGAGASPDRGSDTY